MKTFTPVELIERNETEMSIKMTYVNVDENAFKEFTEALEVDIASLQTGWSKYNGLYMLGETKDELAILRYYPESKTIRLRIWAE